MAANRNDLRFRGTKCLNCEHSLDKSDRYCCYCGQPNSTKKLKFDDFFSEFFSGVFAYDSRFRRTIRSLLFSPGQISKDYISGKRMSYVNPFKFYLSASIIFFIIWNFTSSFEGIEVLSDGQEIQQQLEQDSLNGDIPESIPTPEGAIQLDSLLEARAQNSSRPYQELYKAEADLDTMSYLDAGGAKFNLFSRFYKQTNILNARDAMDSLHYRNTNYNHWLYKKAMDWNILRNDPAVFINYFVNKLPFIIFFYLPVFAMFIWLLYLRRKFNYMEHLIFAFHVQTTFFILYALALLLEYLFKSWAFTTANILFTIYLYKALRNFYGQGRVKTIVKFVLLNLIFFTLAGLAAVISVLASFAIY